MNVLGISGRYRDAAAALAIDGHVVAAASEDCFTRVAGIGYTQTGGFPAGAVEACLQTAGLRFGDVDHLVIVDDEGTQEPQGIGTFQPGSGQAPAPQNLSRSCVHALHADALQAAVSTDSADAVIVCSTHPPAIASFVRHGDQLELLGRVSGSDHLMSAARTMAGQLGVGDEDPLRGIDRLSVGGEPEFQDELSNIIGWSPSSSSPGNSGAIAVSDDRWSDLMDSVGGGCSGSLSDASSLNVRLQQRRRAVAASVTCRVAHVLRDAALSLCAGRLDSVAFGGGMFANSRLTTELRRLLGDGLAVAVAAVPEPAGRALGAALATAADGRPSASLRVGDRLPGLALGPAFSETDVKRTLDNCRLDYIYEPDWRRLFDRVSKMLSQGKVIGWFQGAMGFGPRTMGTRSVLCDPSNRYARHNMNEYLRQVPLDEPLPVAFAPSMVGRCLTSPALAPLAVMDAGVNHEWRECLTAALDWRQYVRVHGVGPSHAPELCDLLECHYGRTGVPALIETNLSGPDEPTACTPRDAVKTVYSSAIDALVIGRFFLMKDYWLLKSHGD
jgi:carbamoyltransferase